MREFFEQLLDRVDKMSEEERLDFQKQVDEFSQNVEAQGIAQRLRYNRALRQNDKDCVRCGNGEYYVYMWLHADGTPFYVGSGKAERWKSINRNESFFEEADKLDALVYKLVDGLTLEESREAEFCLTHYLSYNGYKLTNGDYNYQRVKNQEQRDRRVGKFERLKCKRINKLTLENAMNAMHSHSFEFDLKRVYYWYDFNYGLPNTFRHKQIEVV